MAPELADMRGKLLKAGDAAQPKGCSACFVPVKPKIKNNQDFTGSTEKVG